MATRLYLTNSAAPYTPTTKRGGWEQAGATLARNLGFRPAGAAATAAVATGSTAAANDVLWGRWISPGAVAAGTLSGTVQAIVGAVESIATTNAFLYLHIYVTTGDSDTPRGTALSNFVGATEFTTTANGRDSAAQTLTSVAVSVGDRLVVEIGYRSVSADTTARTATLNYGNTGTTDLTSGSTSVTTQPGWIQFSAADGIWAPLTSSITDTFPGATLNSTNWPATGGTVVVSGGTAKLDTSAFVAIYSDNGAGPYYQFRDSSFFFEVPAVPAGGGYYAGWKIVPDDVSGLMVGTYAHGDGTIGFELNGSATSITYSATDHRWWRFRHDGTTAYWETSPDASTWTTRRSVAAASWTNYADLKFLFEGGGGGSSPDYYQIDNVNTVPATSAPATEATGTGTAPDAAVSLTVTATEATGTGSAQDPTASVAPNASVATGAGVAADASVATTVNAAEAAGTGTAYDATVSTSSATNANAAEATGTGSALTASVAVAVNAAEASGTGAANTAQTSITVAATEATGSGSAADAAASVAVNADAAVGTGAAQDATVSTSSSGSAPATEATGTGSALDATAALGVLAGIATGTGAAFDAAAAVAVNAVAATGTGSASDATVTSSTPATEATGTGSAGNATIALAVNAAEATGAGSAFDATVSTSAQTSAPAAEATGTGAAYPATITLTTFAGVATATGAAHDATVITGAPGSANAGTAAGTGQAFDARVRKGTPRPYSGVTARLSSGTTPRPFAGVTPRP